MSYWRIITTMLFLAVCCLMFSFGFLIGRRTVGGTYTIMTESESIGRQIRSATGLKGSGEGESAAAGFDAISHKESDGYSDSENPADIIDRADAAVSHKADSSEVEGLLVNINTCTVEQLTLLPSIGETRAKSIIRYREENGPFRSIADIMQVPGIGESIFDRIKQYIYVDMDEGTGR